MVAGEGTPPTTAHHGHAGQVPGGTTCSPLPYLKLVRFRTFSAFSGWAPGPFDGLGSRAKHSGSNMGSIL